MTDGSTNEQLEPDASSNVVPSNEDDAVGNIEFLLSQVFESAAVGMAIQDPLGVYRRANPTFCRMIGYAEEELIGRSYSDFTFPDDLDEDSRLDDEMLSGQRQSHQGQEKRYLHKDGRLVWALTSAALVRDPDDIPLGRVVVVQDITQRKQAEQQLGALERESGELRQALINRKLIERAKGLLMKSQSMDETDAFAFMQKAARSKNKKLIEIARLVVESNGD